MGKATLGHIPKAFTGVLINAAYSVIIVEKALALGVREFSVANCVNYIMLFLGFMTHY